MLFELGQPAGKQADRIAGRVAAVIERLLGLKLYLGVLLADVTFGVFAGMIVKLQIRFGVAFGRFGVGEQLLARLLEVIVVELDFAGAKAPLRRPMINVLAIASIVAGERDEGCRFMSRHCFVR